MLWWNLEQWCAYVKQNPAQFVCWSLVAADNWQYFEGLQRRLAVVFLFQLVSLSQVAHGWPPSIPGGEPIRCTWKEMIPPASSNVHWRSWPLHGFFPLITLLYAVLSSRCRSVIAWSISNFIATNPPLPPSRLHYLTLWCATSFPFACTLRYDAKCLYRIIFSHSLLYDDAM